MNIVRIRMEYKIVRTDSQDRTEIDLICGLQSFGRNNFLDCDDKRVSRSHGQIEISDNGGIELKALHSNPCFLKRKGSAEVIILNHGEVAEISEDDQFGLLPGLYWYKVMKKRSDTDVEDTKFSVEAVVKTEPSAIETAASNPDASKIPDIVIKKEIVDDTENSNSTCMVPDISKMKRSHSTEDREDSETTVSPKLRRLSVGHSSTATSNEEAENVSVKQEPLSPKKELKEESCSANAEPVNEPQVQHVPQPPVVQAPAVLRIPDVQAMKRERCYYGSNCYRKNIVHKQQYSHPTDADWGREAMTPCPYGMRCMKLDQRHFRDHSHPHNVRILVDHGRESDEEDDNDGSYNGSEASVDLDYDF